MTPGGCPHEARTLRVGRQVKSLCTLRGREVWTNCRHHGFCTMDRPEPARPEPDREPTQPRLF